ncbi:SAV_6107 family HEPN domain-containing protein [Rhodococcus daqingensis]|uniref:SAV_6107 family HEPN domain-containing protein n=1 Tax=Rhodococcus daqingensis TaxID=2479363 RepID=A0ABW2RTM8_9NOCA
MAGQARAALRVGAPASSASHAVSRVGAPVSRHARALLDRADALLAEAAGAPSPSDRFRSAYLAALRGAGAALGGGQRPRTRSRSAWVLLARAEPSLAGWSEFFAGYSATRAAIEAGISRTITASEAEDFYFEVSRFLTAVEDHLGGDRHLVDAPHAIVGRSA